MAKSPLWLGGTIVCALLLNTPALAQSITATPDGTGTIIHHNGNTYHIQGGTQAGANLFHSFQDFGLTTGEIADFLSNPSITNIFGRVTGGNVSVIDGLIQATPNLYLLNPAGIMFGTNAQLNVEGDFFATTADQICFETGCFNAWGANDVNPLSGSPTTLGFLQHQPGGLINAGTLAVQKGKSIHLSGGTVVNLGEVLATGGNVAIAAIPGERQVRLAQSNHILSLELSSEVLTTGINPLDLPALLTATPVLADTKVIEPGTVALGGTVQGEQIDLYAADQVQPSESVDLQGDTRVVRFSETGENPTQAIFIDRRADNPEDLLFGAATGTVSQIIERDDNGLSVVSEQLTVISNSVGEIESVAIVAEGNQGNFWLGNQWVRADNIGDYAAQLQTWGEALTESADMLLYSCFTALGATGEALVQGMTDRTGADVAASVNATSSANYGGDWVLEQSTGPIEAANPFTTITLANWQGKLATRTVTDLGDSGASTLRDALTGTAGFGGVALAAGDTVDFALSGTINLSSEIAWSVDDVTIDGSGQAVVLDGGGNNRIFATNSSNTTLKNLTIQNGSTSGQGGGIRHEGQLNLENITLLNNTASSSGGGIYVRGQLEMTDSLITNNVVTGIGSNGGGVDAFGSLTLTNSTISGNTVISSLGSGGGAYVSGAVTLNSSNFVNNVAGDDGGGLATDGPYVVTVNDSTVTRNVTRYGGGGGISVDPGGVINIVGSTISGNSAGRNGGGITSFGVVNLTHSTISGNSATGSGGGIFTTSVFNTTDVNLTNSTIADNTAGDKGGGIYTWGRDTRLVAPFNPLEHNATLIDSTISGNSSVNGGGGIWSRHDVTATNSPIDGNQSAHFQNTDIYSLRGNVTLSSDGDLNLTDTIQVNTATYSVVLKAKNVNISTSLQSGGSDIYINAQDNVNALTAEATISSSGATVGGNITILAGNDLNLRNIISTGLNGDGGDITITSIGGVTTTTFGGSEGLINSSGNNGNAGNISIETIGAMTLGSMFAESLGGAGGTVNLESSSLVRITQTNTGLFGTTGVSISTAGSAAGGVIKIRHGGLGLIPFTVGHASRNGTAGSLNTGVSMGQILSPTQSFLYNFTQGDIQILSTNEPAPILLPSLGSNPPPLEFYAQSPIELFVKMIGDQLGAETNIDYEENKFAWDIPGEPTDIVGSVQFLDLGVDISAIDEQLEGEYERYFEEELDEREEGVTIASIRKMLTEIEQQTGTRSVIVYALSYPEALELLLITPSDEPMIRKVIPEAPADLLRSTVRSFRRQLNRRSPDYQDNAQQLYRWLIAPIQAELESYNVNTLVFAMSSGLRSIPLAALHDGNQFLVEQYSLGIIPSVSLTNRDYRSLENSPVLAMGASEFQTLNPLPAVPLELRAIAQTHASSRLFLNETFTLDALQTQSQQARHQIVHLATHAKFRAGRADQSYIQFWNQAVGMDELRSLGWYAQPQVELLVLSACETAIGDAQAELGFAGLAVQTGAKSALASLWQVSDVGTLVLMRSLYEQLGDPAVSLKAEALRLAQLALLRGELTAQDVLSGAGERSSELSRYTHIDLSHPYYWSGFTLVGSPW